VAQNVTSEPKSVANSETTAATLDLVSTEPEDLPRYPACENTGATFFRKTDCPDDYSARYINPNGNPGNESEGVSAIIGAVTGEPQNQGFLGSSSAAAFMKHIREAVDSRAGVESPEGVLFGSERTQIHPESGHGQQLFGSGKRKSPLEDYVLPPRKLADSLSRAYWANVYPLYPFLDRRNFTKMYNDIWNGTDDAVSTPMSPTTSSCPGNPTSLCIFNLVLALACQYPDTIEPGKSQSTARVFFLRAKDLLRFDPVDSADRSIYLVQALLLMGQYLQSIGSTHKAWRVVGIAIRVCHELGLHRAVTTSEEVVPKINEREMMRRVYHGCVMMERYVF
jgi:hypothetical protein